jgi:hypothetical protein
MPIVAFPPKLYAFLNADATRGIRGYRQFLALAIVPGSEAVAAALVDACLDGATG